MKNKIITIDDAKNIASELRAKNKKIILCHGVFDLLHIGHIDYLSESKSVADTLIVSLTEDKHVNKGPNRPVFNQTQRARAIAALQIVDHVVINNSSNAINLIKSIKPNLYSKGRDYKNLSSDITGMIKKEKDAIKSVGGDIYFAQTPLSSSTKIMNTYEMVFDQDQSNLIKKVKKELNGSNIQDWIDRLYKINVLVVGELIVDEYVFCEALGKSGKEPVLALRNTNTERYAGGVAAIARHLSSFVQNINLISYLGEKQEHLSFFKKSMPKNINLEVVAKSSSPSIVKKRFIEKINGHKLLGVYDLDEKPLNKVDKNILENKLRKTIKISDLIIVVDYGHGLLSNSSLKILTGNSKFKALNAQINSSNIGHHTMSKYKNYDLVIINETELRHEYRDRESGVEALMRKLQKDISPITLVVTQGRGGAKALVKGSKAIIACPAFASKVVDKVGSGDAMLSLLSICLSAKLPIHFSLLISSLAAAHSVETVGNKEPFSKKSLMKILQHSL